MTQTLELPFAERTLLGVVHLPALPGSPAYAGRERVRESALADAEALMAGGVSGFVVENFGDTPFRAGAVDPIVLAEMAVVVAQLRERFPRAMLGVNVLRNDARGGLAVAAATGADFIRVNVWTGEMITDQGRVTGDAARVTRERVAWDADVKVWADVAVKHATPPPGFDLEQSAADTAYRGLADGLIVTGRGTGASTSLAELKRVRQAVPDRPVWIGSGLEAASVADAFALAHGAIVGTSLKVDRQVRHPVDPTRVEELVAACRAAGYTIAHREGSPRPPDAR